MNSKGSITVFFSLILTAVTTLILTSVLVVKVQAGRAMLANSADQAVFSLFSEYDRDLAERYGLCFIDLGMDTGDLCPGECIDFVNDCADRILDPENVSIIGRSRNILNISDPETSIDGYRLLFENGGDTAASQIVDYMKDTAGLQLISAVSNTITYNNLVTDNMESTGENIDMGSVGNVIDLTEGRETSLSGNAPEDAAVQPVTDPESISKAFRFLSTAGKINIWRHRSLLDLVVKDTSGISGKVYDVSNAADKRAHPESLGVIEFKNDPDSFSNRLLINEYILAHTGSYTAPSEETSLSYQLEYVISGRPSDRDSLSFMVNRLMLIRMGTNFAHLNSDSALKDEAAALASVIASLFLSPELEPVFETAIEAAWSWGESILDIRTLLSGGRIPLIKNRTNWKLTLEDLPAIFTDADSLCSSDPSGLSYTDYMRIFLYSKSRTEIFPRFLDTAEDTIRKCCSRPQFRIDLCADEMEITLGADIENIKTFYTARKYSYSPAQH